MKTASAFSELFGLSPNLDSFATAAEAALRWRKDKDAVMTRALHEERLAYSYRSVHYGAAFLVCVRGRPEKDRFGIISGANFTLLPSTIRRPVGWQKMCAEVIGIAHGRDSFASFAVIGAAVFSNHMRTDDVSGIFLDIPYPCYQCCGLLLDEDVAVSTPFVLFRDTGLLESDRTDPRRRGGHIVEEKSFGEILRLHNYQTG